MKHFLKPTKAKIVLTLLFLLLLSFLSLYSLSFFGSDLMDMCLPNIPGSPTPTPQPFSFSRTLNDLPLTESHYPCLKNDPSAQFAFSLQHFALFLGVLFSIFVIYFVACTITFFVAKLNPSKKSKRGNN